MLSRENTFLVLTVSCIAANKLTKLPDILKRAKSANVKPEKLYEAILQTYLFCGFPSTIESLKAFNKVFNYKADEYNVSNIKSSGQKVCKIIYGANYLKLLKNMASISPDLKNWMIEEGYGKVLSRPGLTLKQRELINASILSTSYFPVQLLSHLIGALNAGSSKQELQSVIKQTQKYNSKANIKKALKMLSDIR
jgi:alkylhydroperoxidase/carboxymuconolactone decarboxylase family protein YurZ